MSDEIIVTHIEAADPNEAAAIARNRRIIAMELRQRSLAEGDGNAAGFYQQQETHYRKLNHVPNGLEGL